MGHAVDMIERIALRKLLFRERDIEAEEVSPSCLDDARIFGIVKSHGHGVWSHRDYEPTRYEVVQIRLENAVFWGPSALWLQGFCATEPEVLWLAIENKAKRPTTLALGSVVMRSRKLERDVVTITPPGTLTELRVHSRQRAEADVAKNDLPELMARALRPRRFTLVPKAEFLSAKMVAWPMWTPDEPPDEEWVPGHAPRRDLPKVREDWSIARSFPRAHESRGPAR